MMRRDGFRSTGSASVHPNGRIGGRESYDAEKWSRRRDVFLDDCNRNFMFAVIHGFGFDADGCATVDAETLGSCGSITLRRILGPGSVS